MFKLNHPCGPSRNCKNHCFLLLFMFFAGLTVANAQGIQEVKGTVADSKGQPAIGVTASVKGSNTRTLTDQGGTFTIRSAPSATLSFTAVNFEPLDVQVVAGQPLKVYPS